jgi:hypothetical protein
LDKGTSSTSRLLAFVELRKTVLLLVACANIDVPLQAKKTIIIIIEIDTIVIGINLRRLFELLLLFPI